MIITFLDPVIIIMMGVELQKLVSLVCCDIVIRSENNWNSEYRLCDLCVLYPWTGYLARKYGHDILCGWYSCRRILLRCNVAHRFFHLQPTCLRKFFDGGRLSYISIGVWESGEQVACFAWLYYVFVSTWYPPPMWYTHFMHQTGQPSAWIRRLSYPLLYKPLELRVHAPQQRLGVFRPLKPLLVTPTPHPQHLSSWSRWSPWYVSYH